VHCTPGAITAALPLENQSQSLRVPRKRQGMREESFRATSPRNVEATYRTFRSRYRNAEKATKAQVLHVLAEEALVTRRVGSS
jgi:hypothetical protein